MTKEWDEFKDKMMMLELENSRLKTESDGYEEKWYEVTAELVKTKKILTSILKELHEQYDRLQNHNDNEISVLGVLDILDEIRK